MTNATIAADFHQALDVQRNLTAQVALHLQVLFDVVTQLGDFVLGKVLHAGIGADFGSGKDFLGRSQANAEDVSQADLHTLFSGQVNARNTCHVWYTSM